MKVWDGINFCWSQKHGRAFDESLKLTAVPKLSSSIWFLQSLSAQVKYISQFLTTLAALCCSLNFILFSPFPMVPVSLYFSNIGIMLSHPHILSVKAMCWKEISQKSWGSVQTSGELCILIYSYGRNHKDSSLQQKLLIYMSQKTYMAHAMIY